MKKILLILLILYSYTIYSQKVYVEKYPGKGIINVYVTDYLSNADLLVYKTTNIYDTDNEGAWYFVEYKQQADKRVYFVKYPSQATLIIYYVKYPQQAGWRSKNRNDYK